MFRPHRTGDLRRSLSIGGRVPPVIGLLLLLILAATVGSWIARTSGWAVLSPALLLRGELWRLFSWPFVQEDPLALIFGGFILYSFGTQLVHDWGEGRFLATFLGLSVGASLLTLLVALVWAPFAAYGHLGMWPVVDALLLMWALRYPDQRMSFWGVLPMTGRTLALLLVFGTVLYGLAAGGIKGLLNFTPHFAALLIAWILAGGRLGIPIRRLRLQLRDWWLERQLRRRSRHLKVVRKNGHGGEPPSWLN